MNKITFDDAVDAVRDYTTAFTQNVSGATKERWVNLLLELGPRYGVLQSAIKRCAENDLSAAWSRLRSSINIETTLARQKGDRGLGDQSDAFESWAREYRNDGFSAGYPDAPKDNSSEASTAPKTASACWSVINDIVRRKTRCPEPWAKHDIYATGDEEERWFWMTVEDRQDGK